MTRLEQMRLYRSHLANEARSLADHYVKSSGTGPDTCPQVQARLNLLQQRMRSLNSEIDKLEAINYGRVDAQPHAQFATV
jgi:hypothetical protein